LLQVKAKVNVKVNVLENFKKTLSGFVAHNNENID